MESVNRSHKDNAGRNAADEASSSPTVSRGSQRTKRNGMAWIALACVIALVLVGGVAGAAAGYHRWCERVTPSFVDVPAALQQSGKDDWGSYSTKLAVDLDGQAHALKATYDDPAEALANFEDDHQIISYLRGRYDLPQFDETSLDQYRSAAATQDRDAAPSWYAEELTEFMAFTDRYGADASNAEAVQYMQCKTASRLKNDSTFMNWG